MTNIIFDLLCGGTCKALEKLVLSETGKLQVVDMPSLFGVIGHPEFGVILVDTGYERVQYDNATMHGLGWIYRMIIPVYVTTDQSAVYQLEQMGIFADDVKYVIITHFHADHICALKSFTKAKYVVGTDGWKHFRGMNWLSAGLHAFFPELLPNDFEERLICLSADKSPNGLEKCHQISLEGNLSEFKHGWDLFGDSTVIVVELPGHCLGHLGVLIRAPKFSKMIFMIGDSCWSQKSVSSGELPHFLTFKVVHHNAKEYTDTIAKLNRLYSKSNGDIVFVPSHCFSALDEWQKSLINA